MMSRDAKAFMVVALVCCASAPSAELGRLFTTAEERLVLDRPPGKADAPVRRVIPVQGLISRGGGEPIAWVDDKPLRRGDAGAGFVLLDAGDEGALIMRDAAAVSADTATEDDPGAAP